MFTGIVEATGTVVRREALGIEVATGLADLALGDSVAVNGCCLTVTALEEGTFRADLSEETLRRTALGRLATGSSVNLERPMRADGRFGGHIVQGHVDGVGTVAAVEARAGSTEVRFAVPPGIARYLVEKGSVTVDGVSLTVASLVPGGFAVALVPHTLGATTLASLEPGAPVNIEVDVVAKYVERLLLPAVPGWTRLGSAAAAALGEDPLGTRAIPLPAAGQDAGDLRGPRVAAASGGADGGEVRA